MQRNTKTRALHFSSSKISDGLGFGEGSISFSSANTNITPESIAKVERLIQKPDILVPVDKTTEGKPIDDDGCGDGRGWSRVFQGSRQYKNSLHRAKVFGGGATMAAAGLIGMGQADGMDLVQTFDEAIERLKTRQIDFGAHTDNHADGDKCGCGAIDNAPKIIENIGKYESEIKQSLSVLYENDHYTDEVLISFKSFSANLTRAEFSGAKISKNIIGQQKVVKELADEHKEMFIIINNVEDYTVNQQIVRQVSDNQIQVFAVDNWRLKNLAERMYPPVSEGDNELRKKFYISELIYTLSTAATLTKGDLPVYLLQ